MRGFRRVLVLSGLALGGVFSSAPAQEAGATPTRLDALTAGQRVRIRTADVARLESRVRTVERDRALLWLEDAPTPLDAAAIDSLWVRGSAATTGMFVVGFVVAVSVAVR
ncbi:MAG: hypothetical protein ACE5HF_09765 [Gemmatimonadota bacterium]